MKQENKISVGEFNKLNDNYQNLSNQVDELSLFIMNNINGEPSESQGAIDTAIRLLGKAVAKEPIYGDTDYSTGDYFLGREITCPYCGERICFEHSNIPHFNYCSVCGQKIDKTELSNPMLPLSRKAHK